MSKSPDAFRTISEVAELLGTPAHVLRFWETRFPQIRPVKRAGGRRYYRPGDVALLLGIKRLLYEDGFTIRGVQKMLREQGIKQIAEAAGQPSPPDFTPELPEDGDFLDPVGDLPLDLADDQLDEIEEPDESFAEGLIEEDAVLSAPTLEALSEEAPLEEVFSRLMPAGEIPPVEELLPEAEPEPLPLSPEALPDDVPEAPILLWAEEDIESPTAEITYLPLLSEQEAQTGSDPDGSDQNEDEMNAPDSFELPAASAHIARQLAHLRRLTPEMLSLSDREELTCLRDLAQQLLARLKPADVFPLSSETFS